MTVYRQKGRRTYLYDFQYGGIRYRDTTHQTGREDAKRVEAKVKERLRLRAGGIYVPGRDESPRFQDWAEVFYAYKATRLERPDALEAIIPSALRFWGQPTWPNGELVVQSPEHPCHDLRLADPIVNPDWLLRFEIWLTSRGLSNQSKNHYRGLMRRMYAVAMLPEYRQRTNITMNPFAGMPNDPTVERTVTVEPEQFSNWIRAASYHIRLAVAIAALAPKLRLRNILDLRWDAHFVPDPRATKFSRRVPHFIEVHHHKTARRTRRPMVSPVSAQLLRILKDAWTRQPSNEWLVMYHGRPVHNITGGVQAAAEAAGLTYGRDVDGGVTFHTIRHTAATLISEHEADPLKLMDAMGHGDVRTSLKYRHLRPHRQKVQLERLSRQLPIEDLVTVQRSRAAAPRKKAS